MPYFHNKKKPRGVTSAVHKSLNVSQLVPKRFICYDSSYVFATISSSNRFPQSC